MGLFSAPLAMTFFGSACRVPLHRQPAYSRSVPYSLVTLGPLHDCSLLAEVMFLSKEHRRNLASPFVYDAATARSLAPDWSPAGNASRRRYGERWEPAIEWSKVRKERRLNRRGQKYKINLTTHSQVLDLVQNKLECEIITGLAVNCQAWHSEVGKCREHIHW